MHRAAPWVPDHDALEERLPGQAQERAQRLQPVRWPLLELARRLLTVHPDWDMAEQIHLQYVSLEIAACPAAEPVVESREAEGWEWQGQGGAAVTIAGRGGWSIIGTPEFFECPSDYTYESAPLVTQSTPLAIEFPCVVLEDIVLMDVVVAAVEQDVLAQALLVRP